MSPISSEDRAALEEKGWFVADESTEGFTIIGRGSLDAVRLIGSADLELKSINDEGFELPGRVHLTVDDNNSEAPASITASVSGWRGHAESTTGLRAQAAVIAYAANEIDRWTQSGGPQRARRSEKDGNE